MVLCERMVTVDDATRESVIMKHCSEFPLQSVPVGLSCSEVGCSVLDSNIELSNFLDGCKYFSTNEESGSASWIDVTDMPSNARASEYEDADMLLVQKTLDNDCQNCCRTFCGPCEVSNLENGSLSTEEKTHNQDDYQLLSEFKSVNGSPKDMESNIIPSAGDTLVAVEEKNNDSGLLTDTGNHIFDFIYSEYSLESEPITGCLVNFHTKSEQEDILRNTDPLEVVDNCNTLSGMEVTACKQISSAQGSNVPSDETSTYCTFSSESGLPSFVSLNDNNPSKDVPDLLLKDNSCVISYNNNACNSGQNDDEGKQIFKIDCVTKSKCSDTVLLPRRRNSQQNKSACKQQTGRAPGKCNKQANMPQQELGVKTILKSTRKKRSCFSRAARSSEWALLGNVKQAIGMNRELNTNKVMFERSGKARGSCQSGKTNKDSENSSTFNSMSAASTTHMRLKIKVGKEFSLYYPNVIVPESVDGLASASHLSPGSGSQNSANNTGDKLFEEVAVGKLESDKNNLNEVAGGKLESDKNNLNKYAVVLNGQIANNLESTALVEKSDGNAEEPCLVAPSKKLVDALIEPVYIKGMDPGTGTSPDSEVIDSIPEVRVGERHQEDLNDTDFVSSKEFNFAVHDTASKRKKKKDTLTCSLNSNVRDVSPDSLGKNKANYSKNLGGKKNCTDAVSSVEFPRSTDINTISISNSVGGGEVHTEPLHLHGDIGLREPTGALEVKSSLEVKMHCSLDANNVYSDSPVSEKFLPSERHLDSKLPKSLKSDNVSKTKSKASESKSRKKTACRHGEKQGRSITKRGVKGKSVSDKVICETEDYLHEENDIEEKQKLGFSGKIYADENKVVASGYTLDMVLGVGLGDQHPSPRNAWVCCDDCHKWRRIPASLADLIEETLCAWTCKDSDDKAYADCSITQEKSNAEINAELGLSDASGEEDNNEDHKNYKKPEHQRPVCSQESTFTHISANEFLHRSCKTQTIDEIMVCHCKPPPKGQLGCGDECLNRMLNIECVQGACPCGDLCSNQQFQKRNYANLKWFKCGKKGYGLQTIEGISEGQFLIEYVGEVLDMHAYEARQREYALRGQRHFYFMTLNGSEVIDASAKGNLGRFINHSCDPNCRTEKWMVNGEIGIGLFALRDIKQDEEVTFDYNYVRVFGAAAKKCYCGSPHCRGYIGGDPLNADIIAQDDSDEEFPEPVMLTEAGDIEHGPGALPGKQNSLNPASASSQLHSSIEVENSKGNLSSSIQMKVLSQQVEDVTSKPMPVLQQGYALEPEHSDNTLIPNMETSSFSSASKSKYEVIEDRCGLSEPRLLVKASHINGSVKKGKVCANPTNNLKVGVTTNRLQVPSIRHKKSVEGSSNGRFEAVEEKLKELLDPDGGISKSKDATKGYLKLLLLTVASGDRSNGEAIQSCSNRDLSMILGALLETRSRAVLNDIIKKNGLRMLHNIMKQYRRDFKKIPILRKLLKVLERLAERKILTSEHINGGPPCRGMESFRESILFLTEHEDKEVHQIARSFRDRWIPKSFRKRGFVNRDDCGVKSYRSFKHNRLNYACEQSSRPTKAIDCAQLPLVETSSVNAGAQEECSAPSLNGCEISGQVRRKRKSRWDQPAETNSVVSSEHKKGKVVSGQSKQVDVIINAVVGQNISEEVPPGFSCLVQPLSFSDASRNSGDLALQRPGHYSSGRPSDAVIGYPREKFNPCLPVSYGVPWPVIQQYGTPHVENEGSWVTAPGMPFYPFPPLPPHVPQNACQSSKPTDAMKIDQPAEIVKRDSSGLGNCYSDDMAPSTTGLSCEDNNHISNPLKGSPKDLGRSYFGQQKWNKSRIPRPWSRRKFWGYNESNSRGGMGNVGVVDVPDDAICTAVEADNSNN